MGSELLRPESENAAPTSSTEIEFALVLSRMIDSVKSDPEYLRSAVYELARAKLKEQFGADEAADMPGLTKSLETAIQGVESFVQKNGDSAPALPRPGPAQQQHLLDSQHVEAGLQDAAGVVNSSYEPRSFSFTAPWRFALVIALALAVVFAIKQGATVQSLKNQIASIANLRMGGTSEPAAVSQPAKTEPAAREPAQPPPLTPTAYGIYAVSDDKLYELEVLPGRAPDIRVAVSPVIPTASKTTLPDGHLKFIVYRRDSATNAADHAEVRIVAKIARETNFNPAGKAIVSKVDDAWVIRNIAIPFRTAPKKDSPDMYEVQSENPDGLTPGRYALILKGQAYDFSVAGNATDPRQCLERLAASNGQFYSECQKP